MYKIIKLTLFILLISSVGAFAQTTTPSVHPKLDKYYPQPQKTQILDNNANNNPVVPPAVRSAAPSPVVTTAPASTNTVVNNAPAVTPTTPAPPAEPEFQAAPAVTSTPVTVEPANTSVSNSNTLTAPAEVTVNKPVQKIVPQSPAYFDPASLFTTRLGSSSPQYDTWQKNNNGAGAVSSESK